MNLIEETKEYIKYSSKINKITKSGKATVYNLEVGTTHKYLANGFYVANCTHPDIEEFITVKSDYTRIQNANISCQITDDFYKAVEKDKDWDLVFEIPEVKKGQKVFVDVHSIDKDCLYDKQLKKWYKIATHNRSYEKIKKTVKAKKILELIAKNMTSNAEPGIQNIDIARKYSNSDYVYDPNDEYDSRILSTNAPVVGDTLIPTADGIYPIKDLYKKNENILVLADTMVTLPQELIDYNSSKKVWGKYNFPTKTIPVLARFKKYPNQKVWKITLNDGQVLKCNEEHKWFINGSMTSTKDIKKGDKLYKPNGGIAQAFNLQTEKMSEDFKEGQLIGYFVGNGWIGKKDDTHNKMIGIVYDKDSEYYSQLFRNQYFKITSKELLYEKNRGSINEVRCESKKFVEYIESFGFKENKYHIPQKCYTNLNFAAGFLNGLFQADGCVQWNDKQGNVTLTTVNINIAYKVSELLMNWFGIHSTIQKSKGKPVKYKTLFGEKLSQFKDRFDVKISVIEKIIGFKNFIGLNGNKEEKIKEIHNNCQQYNNRINCIVTNVEETNEYEDMYCAVVDGLESFIVNGFISSNCCISGDTKIMTNKGWLTIKEIYDKINSQKESDLYAMSYNQETKLYELKPILNAWQQRNDVTVELEIEEEGKIYKIECSSDHKIMTKNRGYVEASSLTDEDDILIFK
jgi:ribonucleotide reductase alpha subunit